jgi:hypothetical protein
LPVSLPTVIVSDGLSISPLTNTVSVPVVFAAGVDGTTKPTDPHCDPF